MDIQAYIASGVLEDYALGMLTAEERAAVEAHAAQHPEIKAELEAIELTMENYAMAHQAIPSDKVKTQLLAQIGAEEDTAKVIPIQPTVEAIKPGGFSKWIAAAAVLAFVLSIGYNVMQSNRMEAMQQELADLNTQQNVLLGELGLMRDNYAKVKGDLEKMLSPEVKPVMLSGEAHHKCSKALVYWNTETKETYLNVEMLPEPPENMQYQLWAFVDGEPVDMGVFSFNPNQPEIHPMKHIEGVTAFAVTLEQMGGSTHPDMDQMYVKGSV